MITLALIGLVGGLVTGVSPCVLPMLPIIFVAGSSTSAGTGAVAAPPRQRNSLRPLKIVAGVVTSFSLIALFGTAVLQALGLPDRLLLWIGLVVLVAGGLGLIFPALGDVIERPFYALPKFTRTSPDRGGFLFGLGLGTLYVPCAGPVLAAIVVAGATGQVGWNTVVLTVSFAIGAALPLLFFAAAGERIGARINAYRSRARVFRTVAGVVLIALAVALAFDAPAALQRALPNYTADLEQRVANSDAVQALAPDATDENRELANCTPGADDLMSCGKAPSIKDIERWFNTPDGAPVDLADLRGKVVLIDFWAYSCINCQRDGPHIRSWYSTYRDAGFEVIGIHSPEFAFEKDAGNVADAIDKDGITYPVGQDNSLATWTNYRNRYWPAKYLIDATGTVRAIKFGEGDYTGTESKIRALLAEANPGLDLPDPVEDGTQDTPATAVTTPETYLGWGRSSNYRGDPAALVTGGRATYTLAPDQAPDTYSLGGTWDVGPQFATPEPGAQSRISVQGRKVFHVLAGDGTVTVSVPGRPDRTIRVSGTPNSYELYDADEPDRTTLTLTYSGGLQAYTFTFG